jgi:uncharacterized protein DUF4235
MAGKGASRTFRSLKEAAGLVAAVAARRGLQLTWKHTTGSQPPVAPDDEQVPLGQALLWAFLVGAAMTTARMIAMRYASHLLPSAERESLPEPAPAQAEEPD